MMSTYKEINTALSRFNARQFQAQRNAKTVDAFIRKIKYLFRETNCESFCQNSYFIQYGSYRERTVVTDDADFDYIMVLPHPFTTSTFVPVEYEPGVFTLHLREKYCGISGSADDFLTPKTPRRLRVLNLRQEIFDSLRGCVQALAEDWNNWDFQCRDVLTNFKVTLTDRVGQRGQITIDIIPQIGVDLAYDRIPGCEIKKFPDVFHSYMNSYKYSAFYVLAFPPHLHKDQWKHLLVQVNFGLLEMCAIQYSANVRNTVRLCKAISLSCGMREYGLQHYHIKRMAISILDHIVNDDPYDGVVAVLGHLYDAMRTEYLCGYFIDAQDIYERSPRQRQVVCSLLRKSLNRFLDHDFSDLYNN